MSKPGPKRTPLKLLQLRGSPYAKSRGAEPSMDQRRPQRPQWLNGEGKKAWDRIVPLLHAAGLATRANRETLACLCDSWARYVEACEHLRDESAVIKNRYGGMTQNPWLRIRNTMWDQVFKGAACYGMTPADLSSVKAVDKPPADDSKSRFFKGH